MKIIVLKNNINIKYIKYIKIIPEIKKYILKLKKTFLKKLNGKENKE